MLGSRKLKLPSAVLAPLCLAAACTSDAPAVTDESNLADRCEQASARLVSCLGSVPAGFEESCRDDPSPETFDVIDEMIAGAECERPASGKADGLGDTIFAALCTPVLGAAKLISRARNKMPKRELSPEDAALLRQDFGDVVDDVKLYWDAKLLDEWDLGFTDVQFGFDVAAQTFGRRIYFEDSYRPGDRDQLFLIAHELTHAEQSHEFGGFFPEFSFKYCKGFARSGFSYTDHALERDAVARSNEFAAGHLQ